MTDEVYVMPASVAQHRFWILDQLELGNTSLNMPLTLSLTGPLNVNALERAINEIVSRHEILRTTFSREDGDLVQVIAAAKALPLELVNLSEVREKEIKCDQIRIEEAHFRFDLEQGPLFKSKLVRMAEEDHVLLLTLHHIICDGWSNGVLVREMSEIYAAFCEGNPSPYDELPIQYADFAVWQKEWLDSEGFEDQLAYWKSQLGDQLPALEVPTDFPRNKNRTSFGAIESLLLSQPLTRAIKALGQREDSTPFMVYLAAFNILLHRYSGQEKILIGSPTANRQQGETEGLIGAFANTLLLKTDVGGDPTFREILDRVKKVSLDAFSHQSFPFEKLVERIRPSTNGRKGGSLFQVMFIYQTAFMQPVELKDLTIAPIRSVSPGSIFELSLGVVERSEGTRLQLEYNTDLFKAETARRILSDLQFILESALLDVNRKAIDLLPFATPIRSEAEDVLPVESGKKREPAIQTAFRPVDDKTEETLTSIWKEVLHLDSLGPDDDFFEIGGHSLIAAQLFDEIGKRMGVNLPLATLFTATTIRKLTELIGKERPKDIWTSLVPINSKGSKPPLFLMHAAGGNVLFYKDLSLQLGEDQPCYGMQAVGLSGHQSAYDRIEDMAAHYIREIRGVQPQGPYHVGGSSVGGLIAYEVACQLQNAGEEVRLVVMFDTAAPGYPVYAERRSKVALKLLFMKDRIDHHIETIRLLEPGKRRSYFIAKATKAKNQIRRSYLQAIRKVKRGVLTSLGRPLPDALIVTQNAISTAVKEYRPSPYDGKILLFRATKQHRGIVTDDTLGWSKFTSNNLEVQELQGDHGTLVVEPRVRFAAEIIAERLER